MDFLLFFLLVDRDRVLSVEGLVSFQTVDIRFLGEIAGEAIVISAAKPGLQADEGSALGGPDTEAGKARAA